jgi:hypothetical protein
MRFRRLDSPAAVITLAVVFVDRVVDPVARTGREPDAPVTL